MAQHRWNVASQPAIAAHVRDQSYDRELSDTRAIFDFDISFSKGGDLQGRYCGHDFQTGSAASLPPKTNGLAVASLVLGIIPIFGVGAILAVIFGFVSLDQIKKSNGSQKGRGMAIAGVILGFVWMAAIVAFFGLDHAGDQG